MTDAMSRATRWVPCPPAVQARNRLLDAYLRRRWGVSVYLYKSIKALTDLSAVILAFYALEAGLDPTTAVVFVGFVLGGWELVESLALRENSRYTDDGGGSE